MEFFQGRNYYRSMTVKEKKLLVNNIVENLMFSSEPIQKKVIDQFYRIDADLAKKIKEGIGM